MSEHTYETIEVEVDHPIATIRLNRPDRLNALSRELQGEVISALDELEEDDGVRAVILCGAGRAFCTGYDIAGDGPDRSGWSVMDWKTHMESTWRFPTRIWRFRKPIVAAVHGYALGGGCEIAMLADITVASDDCRFGEPEIRFSSGSTLIMPWLVPMKIARELLYTGKLIDAQRAYEIGMVNDIVEPDRLMRRAEYHARLISKIAPAGTQMLKEGINRTYEVMGLLNALGYHDNLVAMLAATQTEESAQFKRITKESGLRAALAWRDEQFREVENLA
jgi:enoyl-CoA hydratase/carnithine racemase